MKSIEIYGRDNCPACESALRFCNERNLRHIYRSISDPQNRAEMFRRAPEARTVPQIFVGNSHIGGFDDLSRMPVSKLQQMIGE